MLLSQVWVKKKTKNPHIQKKIVIFMLFVCFWLTEGLKVFIFHIVNFKWGVTKYVCHIFYFFYKPFIVNLTEFNLGNCVLIYVQAAYMLSVFEISF